MTKRSDWYGISGMKMISRISIHTFLNCGYNVLSPFQALLALHLREIDAKTDEHDGEESRLVAIRLAVLLDVRDNGSRHVETEVFLDSANVISAKEE